jgi:hypothetical protein
MGRNMNIPSIPSPFEPTMSPSVMIYCTTCHADDEGGSRGPHGSAFPPILRERYETNDNTPESYASYALCYRCHNRDSILRNDSFSRHSLHLSARVNAPCSACHDPHGIKDDFISGDHRHLMNFDTRIVFPVTPGTGVPSSTVPNYQSLGFRAGSCTLVCHGRTHVNQRYP